jgi:hypothetical protein
VRSPLARWGRLGRLHRTYDSDTAPEEVGVFVEGRRDVPRLTVQAGRCAGVGEEHPDGVECDGEEMARKEQGRGDDAAVGLGHAVLGRRGCSLRGQEGGGAGDARAATLKVLDAPRPQDSEVCVYE